MDLLANVLAFFVDFAQNSRHLAHSDQPLKEGNVHISAPHMYGSVVEALELVPNSCTSFLNIGSGTGYVSCIVAHILGPSSTNYAVDIHEDVLEHARGSMEEWQEARLGDDNALGQMQVLHGNGLCISTDHGEGAVGLDRIYIGAAVGKQYLNQLVQLLKPGGILVGPGQSIVLGWSIRDVCTCFLRFPPPFAVDDELVKVHRLHRSSGAASNAPPRSLHGHPPPLSSDFSLQVLSSVRFFPLSERPDMPVTLPTPMWSPERHSLYPESFRQTAKTILLCSRAQEIQPILPKENRNVACKLPGFIWMEIFSYTRHDWFEKEVPEEALLRKRLCEEHARNQVHQRRVEELESRLQEAEREKEVYRLMTLRLQRRLQSASDRAGTGREPGRSYAFRRVSSGRPAERSAPFMMRLMGIGGAPQQGEPYEAESDGDSVVDTEDDHNGIIDEIDIDDDAMSTESEVQHGTLNDAVMDRPQLRSVSISTED